MKSLEFFGICTLSLSRVVKLQNEAAKLNGYRDATEMKVRSYESETFVEEMAATWRGLKPLYEQLHAYVRNKLIKRWVHCAVRCSTYGKVNVVYFFGK